MTGDGIRLKALPIRVLGMGTAGTEVCVLGRDALATSRGLLPRPSSLPILKGDSVLISEFRGKSLPIRDDGQGTSISLAINRRDDTPVISFQALNCTERTL